MQHSDPIFRPLKIKSLELRNRFVLPAMQRGLVKDFAPTPRAAEYIGACARGGVGLVITEGAGPDHPSAFWQPAFCVLSEQYRVPWAAVIGAAKAHGAGVVVQLWHSGACRVPMAGVPFEDRPSLSPSGLFKAGCRNGVAMTARDLEEVKAAFVRSALLAKELGADGVEVHCAHGYLLDQFLWSETNVRTDEYGGRNLGERARYPVEIVEAIRAAAGEDFIISVRFSQWKEIDYQARIAETPEELEPFIRGMRRAGADMFHISTRRFDTPEWPDRHPSRTAAGWVKTMTDAPVVAVGSVGLTKDWAADLLEGQTPQIKIAADLDRLRDRLGFGEFDLVAVGRMHVANNDFATKVMEGDLDGISVFDKAVHFADGETRMDHDATVFGLLHG